MVIESVDKNKTRGYRPIQLVALLVFILVSFPSQGQRMMLDKIIALVDEDVVLQSEFDRRMAEVEGMAAARGGPLPPPDQLREEVMEMLVMENLQMQLAERVSIRFDDDTLNRVMGNMAQQNNMTFDQYVQTLEEAGVYLLTREQVRKELTLRELQRGLVNSRITITDQELDNFLSSEMGKDAIAADYLVDHLLVPTSAANDSPETLNTKRAYAADLVARIYEGEELAAVRREAIQAGRFEVTGSNFEWRKADELPSLFTELVEKMTLNDVEGPIPAGNGFHIIQLLGKRGGTEQIVNQTNLRHIMLTPNEIRDEEQTIAAIKRLRQRILDGEAFATIARQNSDDASSVVAGGDLDWINAGGMPLEMETVVNQLDEGQLSEPFRTQTGWHILEVLGRRESDLSQQYSRAQAENVLRERKFDLELQNWLIEIREEAFVEYID